MSEQVNETTVGPRHTFSVYHYIIAPGEFAGSEMIASGELAADEAIAWIRQHVAGSRSASLSLADSAQETQTPAGEGNDQADAPEAASVAPDAVQADGPVAS